jgi:hypothetical protein
MLILLFPSPLVPDSPKWLMARRIGMIAEIVQGLIPHFNKMFFAFPQTVFIAVS